MPSQVFVSIDSNDQPVDLEDRIRFKREAAGGLADTRLMCVLERKWGVMGILSRNGTEAIGLGAVSHLVLAIGLSGHALAQAGSSANQAPPSAGNSTSLSPLIVESAPTRRARRQATQTSSRSRTAGTVRTQANRGSGEQQAAGGAGASARSGESAWGPVDGYVATRSASGTKTDTPLIETPAAISVVTRDQVQAQAAQNISQAVRYTSGGRKGRAAGRRQPLRPHFHTWL